MLVLAPGTAAEGSFRVAPGQSEESGARPSLGSEIVCPDVTN
jgi:hypothetical protein